MFFGDRRLRWARDDVRVQVSLDRGRWFVDVIPAWWDSWFGFGLEIILDTLDQADHFTHLLTFEGVGVDFGESSPRNRPVTCNTRRL